MRQTRYYRLGAMLLVSGAAILAASLLLLRSAPGASTGIALLALGAIVLVLGDSRPRVSPELAQLLLHAGYDNLARLLEELGLRSPAIYLPASLCHGVPRALTASTLPAELWSHTAIIASPFRAASRTMAGGIMSREAHGESTVCTCMSARMRIMHGSPRPAAPWRTACPPCRSSTPRW